MEVDFVDLEANFYSALPVKVDWVDLEARIYFLQWITLDIQTPGFLENFVADSTLTCFCVCSRFSSPLLKWFPASKRSL